LAQAGSMSEPNPTHSASSGHWSGSQLKTVQYPSGWLVSQRRSPSWEQSIEVVQSSPISGLQPAAASASSTSAGRNGRGTIDLGRVHSPDPLPAEAAGPAWPENPGGGEVDFGASGP